MRSTRLWEHIESSRSRLTPSEVVIAEALRTQSIEIALSSALTVATKLGVSEATLIRFAKNIGFASYQAMQQELRDEIRQRLNESTLDRLHRQPLAHSEAQRAYVAALHQEQRNLEATLASVNGADVEKAVQLLLDAKHVFVVGSRASSASAQFAARMFRYVLPQVFMINASSHDDVDALTDLIPGDVVFAIGLSRPSRRTVETLEYAREAGGSTVCITDSPLSPMATMGDVVLIAESQSTSFAQSYTSVMAIINALLTVLVAACPERAEERLANVERLMARLRVNLTQ